MDDTQDTTKNNAGAEPEITYDGESATDDATHIDASDLDDSVVGEENAAAMVKKLRADLKKALAEKQEYLTLWQKDKAEFVNARKRDADAQREMIRFSNENLINELLPVLDSFNMAFSNKDAWEKVDKNWRIGVEYISNQLKKVLEDNGLVEIDPMGKKFDPMRDEAVSFDSVTDEKLDQTVASVIAKGYSYNSKILKAPKVKVGEFKKA